MRRTGLLRVVIVLIGAGIASVEIGCRSAAAIQDSTTPNIPTALQPAPEPLRRPGAATASLIPGDGMEAVRARCVACHEAAMLLQQRLTAQQWMAEIDKMQGWGASVANEDKPQIAKYLVTIAGPDNNRFNPAIVAPISTQQPTPASSAQP